MRAMLLDQPQSLLRWTECARPEPGPDQVLLRVKACGVCRTDLHVCDGELTQPKLPLILGHEIVGVVEAAGERVERFQLGDRVGVPWLGGTCGVCRFCERGQENLCVAARFTGYQLDGGYAEFTVADQRFCFPIPAEYSDAEAAPLLCAGLIGYRSLVMCGDARRLGIYGFGAAVLVPSGFLGQSLRTSTDSERRSQCKLGSIPTRTDETGRDGIPTYDETPP